MRREGYEFAVSKAEVLYKKDENGNPVLIDTTKDGYYYTIQTCTVCGEVRTKVDLKATEFKYAYVDMQDKGTVNIKTNVNTLINGNVAAVICQAIEQDFFFFVAGIISI